MPRTQPNRGSHKKNVPEQHSPKANMGKVEERKQKKLSIHLVWQDLAPEQGLVG